MEAINSTEPLGEPGKGGGEAEETNKTPAGEQTTSQGKWQIHKFIYLRATIICRYKF